MHRRRGREAGGRGGPVARRAAPGRPLPAPPHPIFSAGGARRAVSAAHGAGGAGGGERSGADRLLAEFAQTRARTLRLVAPLAPDDYVVQTAPYTSPPKWHMGHVSWIFEVVLGKIDPSYRPHSAGMTGYLNSYYQQFGEPMAKASRGVVSRPTLEEVRGYYAAVTGSVESAVSGGSCPAGSEAERMLRLGIHHECQHQELLVYDLQHMLASDYAPEGGRAGGAPPDAGAAGGGEPGRLVRVDGGLYRMGSDGGDGEFRYDVEMPEHAVHLEDYSIGALPVTCGEYMRFVEDGGYETYRHWLADGWERARERGWEAPMYWEREGDGNGGRWLVSDFAGRRRPVDPLEPVRNVSFYEADAYCRWAGMRLPTEAEWEKAALWDGRAGRRLRFPWGDSDPSPGRANLLESGLWGCAPAGSYPAGASPAGCRQMIGDVWEWTASEFVGYPGFRSGFDEYNDKWFTGQKVLRGGSFGTPTISIRGTYRNFFRLDERWMIAGFRCAADA